MVNVKFKGFDVDELLHEIKKDVVRDLKKNPSKVLDAHVGDMVEGTCSKCGKTVVEILHKGKAKCTKCGLVTKIDINIK